MIVKKFAKLILFFCLVFIIAFLLLTCLKFLSLWVEWAKSMPPKPETALTMIIAAAHWALSLSLFSSIAVSLNYAVRRKCLALFSIICVMTLSFVFSFGISFVLFHLNSVPPAHSPGIQMGDKGIILSNSLGKNETAVILLNGIADPLGPRVVAIPGQPLTYQGSSNANINIPPVPFRDDTPWFLKNLSIDIRLNSEMFRLKFANGFFPFLFYAGSLIFMLCSLAYIFRSSSWPLANLFLASLAFCGVFSLLTFLNSPEIQETIGSFLSNIIPVSLALPFSFLIFGGLLNVYSLLSFAAKRRSDDDN